MPERASVTARRRPRSRSSGEGVFSVTTRVRVRTCRPRPSAVQCSGAVPLPRADGASCRCSTRRRKTVDPSRSGDVMVQRDVGHLSATRRPRRRPVEPGDRVIPGHVAATSVRSARPAGRGGAVAAGSGARGVGALALSRDTVRQDRPPPRPVALGQGLFAWDAAFYRDIAEHGYRAVGDGSLRFFPLVPMLARGSAGCCSVTPRAALLVVANGSALAFGALAAPTGAPRDRRRRRPPGAPRGSPRCSRCRGAGARLRGGHRDDARRQSCSSGSGRDGSGGRSSRLPRRAVPAGRACCSWCRPRSKPVRGWRTRLRPLHASSAVGAVVAPVAGAVAYLAWVGAEFGDFWKPISLQNRATLRGGFQDPGHPDGRRGRRPVRR